MSLSGFENQLHEANADRISVLYQCHLTGKLGPLGEMLFSRDAGLLLHASAARAELANIYCPVSMQIYSSSDAEGSHMMSDQYVRCPTCTHVTIVAMCPSDESLVVYACEVCQVRRISLLLNFPTFPIVTPRIIECCRDSLL